MKRLFYFNTLLIIFSLLIGFTLSAGHLQFLQAFKEKDPQENSALALALSESVLLENEQVFIQMSDTQFGMMYKPIIPLHQAWNMLNNDLDQEVANFTQAIAFTNRVKPNFAIICGDLINDRENSNQLQAFQSVTSQLSDDIPLYLVSGNHDVDNQPSPESLAAFRKTFGKDKYTFISKNILGLVLNSSLIAYPFSAPEEAQVQKYWLAQELKLARELKTFEQIQFIFIFQHHPYLLSGVYQGVDSVLGGKEGEAYLTMFSEYGVDAVFAGHWHKNYVGAFNNIKMITTGAVGLPDPMSVSRSGLRVVRTGSDDFQHAFIALDDISQ